MPEKDGFTLAEEVRTINPVVPLAFLTAKAMKEDALREYRAGADDYITKPFDPEILLHTLKALMNRIDGSGPVSDRQDVFIIGMFTFNYRLRTIESGYAVKKLSPGESELLRLLCL